MNTLEESIKYLNENYVARKNLLEYSLQRRGNDYYLFLNDEIITVGTADEIEDKIEMMSQTFRRIVLNRGNR